jgi:hypothetical protein
MFVKSDQKYAMLGGKCGIKEERGKLAQCTLHTCELVRCLQAKYHHHRFGIRWRKVKEHLAGKENGDGVPMTGTITAVRKVKRT